MKKVMFTRIAFIIIALICIVLVASGCESEDEQIMNRYISINYGPGHTGVLDEDNTDEECIRFTVYADENPRYYTSINRSVYSD